MSNTQANQNGIFTLEGGLLPADLFNQLAGLQLKGQTAADYNIPQGLTLRDEIGRFWRIAQANWQNFDQQRQRSDLSNPTAAAQHWLQSLLTQVFGFSDLHGYSEPQMIDERGFPITHHAFHGQVPMVFCAPGDKALDTADPRFGHEGRRRSPTGLLQEYLNANDQALWGLVSDGQRLRILRDNPSMTRPAYIEVDLATCFAEEQLPEFRILWLLLHASRFQPGTNNDGETSPSHCWLEQWRAEAEEQGERLLDKLRVGVTEALGALGNGFLRHPQNDELRQQFESRELDAQTYYQELLRMVYRMLFLLRAEARDLLHPEGSDPLARERYREGYSLDVLRRAARKPHRFEARHHDLWLTVQHTINGLATGQPLLALPALGGLFGSDQCPNLDNALIDNQSLLKAIKALTWHPSETSNSLVATDYANMDAEELGSVYEALLELVPAINTRPWQFSFIGLDENNATASNLRKLTGSYYTPDVLVQSLIDTALKPVIRDRLTQNPDEPRQALLDLRVVDPACGSGHFLLAATRTLARELAQLDAEGGEPTPGQFQHALREVLQHCIFGVDLNPMAVELCKAALWMDAIEPGKPLTFLDSHIQHGNSLIGIHPGNQLEDGISSKAFSAKEGDDGVVCKRLSSQNTTFAKRLSITKRLIPTPSINIEEKDEDTLDDVRNKSRTWSQYLLSDDYQKASLAYNIYTAPYFSRKDTNSEPWIPTNAHLDLCFSGDSDEISDKLIEHIKRKCLEFNFFHWELRFPEVFSSGGFDVVLGNPPWDVVKKEEDDSLSKSEHDRLKTWFSVGIYELAKGKKDLYKLFLALSTHLIKANGKVGLVMPVGLFIEDKPLPLRKHLLSTGSIEKLDVYQNNRHGYFGSVHASTLFCAFIYSKDKRGEINFSTIKRYGDTDPHHNFQGNAKDILSRDLTLTLFYNKDDLKAYQKIHSSLSSYKQLRYKVSAEFHASSDKSILHESPSEDNNWKLLKNDGINQFNHKYGSPIAFIDNEAVADKINSKKLPRWLYCSKDTKRLVFRDIARSDDSRTLIACILPYGYVSSYDIPMILPNENLSDEEIYFYLGYMNSLVFDFMVRPHVDKHIKGYIINRLPIPKYDGNIPAMRAVSDNAKLLSETQNGSYNETRSKIDAGVATLANLTSSEFRLICQSFASLMKREEFRTGYVENTCNSMVSISSS